MDSYHISVLFFHLILVLSLYVELSVRSRLRVYTYPDETLYLIDFVAALQRTD